MNENELNCQACDETRPRRPFLNVVLHEPEIAANTGAIGRTCVGLGAKLWLVEPLGFQISDRNLKRAGLDYWPYLDWEVVPCWSALQSRISEIYGPDEETPNFYFFSKNGTCDYDEVKYRWGDVFVFGSESRGLPKSLTADEERVLRIPIRPQIRCLNLSVSVAIAGFEARRQLRPDSL